MFDPETGILRVAPERYVEVQNLSDCCDGPLPDNAAWYAGISELFGEETASAMFRYHRATGKPIRLRVQWRDGSEG